MGGGIWLASSGLSFSGGRLSGNAAVAYGNAKGGSAYGGGAFVVGMATMVGLLLEENVARISCRPEKLESVYDQDDDGEDERTNAFCLAFPLATSASGGAFHVMPRATLDAVRCDFRRNAAGGEGKYQFSKPRGEWPGRNAKEAAGELAVSAMHISSGGATALLQCHMEGEGVIEARNEPNAETQNSQRGPYVWWWVTSFEGSLLLEHSSFDGTAGRLYDPCPYTRNGACDMVGKEKPCKDVGGDYMDCADPDGPAIVGKDPTRLLRKGTDAEVMIRNCVVKNMTVFSERSETFAILDSVFDPPLDRDAVKMVLPSSNNRCDTQFRGLSRYKYACDPLAYCENNDDTSPSTFAHSTTNGIRCSCEKNYVITKKGNNATGGSECEPCTFNDANSTGQGGQAGAYNATSAKCELCKAGFFLAQAGGGCKACAPGLFQPDAGSNKCLSCETLDKGVPSAYQNLFAGTSCHQCPDNTRLRQVPLTGIDRTSKTSCVCALCDCFVVIRVSAVSCRSADAKKSSGVPTSSPAKNVLNVLTEQTA